jgi:hypothetical protein
MATFDPYRKWLGIPPEEQPPNHYRLLGVGLFESDADAISNAADRQMAHVRTFQSGESSDLSQQILNELAAARVCLLDAQKKAVYDRQLRRQLAPQQPSPVPPQLPVPPVPPPGVSGPPVAAPPVPPPLAENPSILRTAFRSSYRTIRRKSPSWLASVIALAVVLLSLTLLAWVLDGSDSDHRGRPAIPRKQTEAGPGLPR